MLPLRPPGTAFRHVVFTERPRPRPLNLGVAGSSSLITPDRSARPRPSAEPTAYGDVLNDDDAFVAWLFRQEELSLRRYRPTSIRRRLPACLRALRVENTDQARELLRRHPMLVHVALDSLLLGVTEFFRDEPVFDCLEGQLKSLVDDATLTTDRKLRVWSAACSDGAELYSVAMSLADLNVLDRCELLGTDCRHDAIRRAKAAMYSTAAVSGVSLDRFSRYVESTGDVAFDSRPFRVCRALRERTTWGVGDVLKRVEPAGGGDGWDVLLCRNMAMYLQPAVAENLWWRLAGAVRVGGLLVTGKAERPVGAAGMLTQVGPCVYRRGEP
jgi:chemotaxis methyl-accepting protein methylase